MKQRIDQLLVAQGYFKTRQKAKESILLGYVTYNGRVVTKPSEQFETNTVFEVNLAVLSYVSRGGFKLEAAIHAFNLNFNNQIVLDVGASTGGFTDCALKHGAKHVYALDVGKGQLDKSLTKHAQVTSYEQTNLLELTNDSFICGEPSIVVMDVSFVSVTKLLPYLYELVSDSCKVMMLLKPQFEAGSKRLNKQGILKHKKDHFVVVKDILTQINMMGWFVVDMTYSPITGGDGNIEYLVLLSKAIQKPINEVNVIDAAFNMMKSR